MADLIYKRANGVFDIIRDSEEVISASDWSALRRGNFFDFKSKSGARLVERVFYYNAQIIDETEGGGAETFSSALAMHIRLQQIGFFDESVGSESGGVNTFKELTDTFATFIGLNGKILAVDEAQNKIIAIDNPATNIAFTDLTDVLSEAITSDMVGQIPRVQMVSVSGNTFPMIVFEDFPTIENTPPDQFTQLGELSIESNSLLITTGFIWLISGIQYGNPEDQIINIENAPSGESRIDIIVTDPETPNYFTLIQGVSSLGEGTAIKPIKPLGTLELTYISIYEDNIVNIPENPDLGGRFIEKEEKTLLVITGNGVVEPIILQSLSSSITFSDSSSVNVVPGFQIEDGYETYKGKQGKLINQQGSDILFYDYREPGADGNFKIFNEAGGNFLLKSGQSVDFYDFTGLARIQANYAGSGIQSVSSLDSEAIDLSDPQNPIFNIATPEYVESKFDSLNTDSVSEGTNNLYFSGLRVLSTILSGLINISGAILPEDSILVAFGKIKKSLSDISSELGLKQLVSNIRTDFSSPNNTTYPSTQAVAEYVLNANDFFQQPFFDFAFNTPSTAYPMIISNVAGGSVATQSDGLIAPLRIGRPKSIAEAWTIRGSASAINSGSAIGVASQNPMYAGSYMFFIMKPLKLENTFGYFGLCNVHNQSPTSSTPTGIYLDIVNNQLTLKTAFNSFVSSGITITLTDTSWLYVSFEVVSSTSCLCRIRKGSITGDLIYNSSTSSNIPIATIDAWTHNRICFSGLSSIASADDIYQIARVMTFPKRPNYLNNF